MSQQPIIIGVADAKTGDSLFSAFTKINANTTEVYADIAAAEAAIVANAAAIVANTSLITGFTKTYWFDASDTATSATPITHTAAATNTYLTNNAIGPNSNSYNPDGNSALWNPATNKFDFTSLKVGDTVQFRIDINLSNAAAQEVDLFMSLAEGTAAPYELSINHTYYKTASTLANDTAIFDIYIGDDNTRTGGARFRFGSTAAATIVVNGWFYKVTVV
tara:strand:+ start:4809 stop:5468 length:660 start_codon:yes stop_codon:yes gene_type:complete